MAAPDVNPIGLRGSRGGVSCARFQDDALAARGGHSGPPFSRGLIAQIGVDGVLPPRLGVRELLDPVDVGNRDAERVLP
jgi:hypothetical protein